MVDRARTPRTLGSGAITLSEVRSDSRTPERPQSTPTPSIATLHPYISSCSFGFGDEDLAVQPAPLFVTCDRRDMEIIRLFVLQFAVCSAIFCHGCHRVEVPIEAH